MGQRTAAPFNEPYERPASRITRSDYAIAGAVVLALLLGGLAQLVNEQPLDVASLATPLARLFDIAAMGGLVLLAHAVGRFTLERCGLILGGTEGAAIASTLGLGVIAYALLALGFVGLYRPWLILILLVALTVALRQSLYRDGIVIAQAVARARLRPSRVGKLTVALIVLCAGGVVLSLAGSLTPPHHHDPLAYHLPLPRHFLRTGIVEPVADIIGSNLPLTIELLFGIGLIWGSAPFAALLHLTFGALTAALLWGATRRWFDATTAWLTLALFLTTPLVLVWARVANNDLPVGCFLLAALALASHPQARNATGLRRPALVLVGTLAGLALSTKYQAAPAVLPLGLWLALSAWRAADGPRWSGRRLWHGISTLLIVSGAAALVVLPWYGRNAGYLLSLAQFLLNVAFPATAHVAEPNASPSLAQGLVISPRTPLGYLLLPIRTYLRGDLEQRYVILNPLFLALPTLLLIPHLWRNRILQVALAMAGAYAVVWALGVQELRYLLAICPFLAIATACVLRRVWNHRTLRPLVSSGIIVAALTTLLLTFLHVGSDRPLAVTLGLESRDSYLRQSAAFGSTYRATSFLLKQLAGGERALFVNEVQTYYLLDDAVAHQAEARSVIDLFAQRYATPQDAVTALRDERIGYLLVNDADLRWWLQGDTDGRGLRGRRAFDRITDQLVVVYQDGPADRPNITIYRVPPAAVR